LATADSIQLGFVTVVSAGNGQAALVGQGTLDGVTGSDTSTVVVAIQPASATLAPDIARLVSLGESVPLTATARDANNNVIPGEAFTFATADAAVATVDANGVTVAVSNGTAVITATTSNGVSATSIVTVQQQTAAVTVTPVAATASSFGDTLVFRAQAVDARGSQVAGATFSWQFVSAAAVIGSLLAAGDSVAFIAQSNGTDGIRATSDGISATADVVVSQTPASVAIAPDSVHFTSIGDGATYRTAVADARGNAITDAAYVWTLDGTTVVTFNGGVNADSARVTSVGNGTALVAVQATRDGTSATDTAKGVVAAIPASVTIAPDTATLISVGGTVDLSGRVTVSAANGNTILSGTRTPTWASLDNSVATVSTAGVVTALNNNGSAGVVATVGAFADTATVRVAIVAGSVDVMPDFAMTQIAGATAYSAAIKDALGTVLARAATWNSANASVATVDGAGSASGVATGVVGIVGSADAAADTATLAVLGDSSVLSTVFAQGAIRSAVQVGQSIVAPVKVDLSRVSNDRDLGSAQFTLSYDAAVLQFDSASTGVSGSVNYNGGTPGAVLFALAELSVQGSADFTLLTIHFTVKSVSVGTVMDFGLVYTAVPTRTGFAAYEAPLVVNG
jgi:hypothetical protein